MKNLKSVKTFYLFTAWVDIKIISSIKLTYIPTWTWETHDWAGGSHIVYNTVVHYTDSTYSTISSVDYFEANRYPIY